MSLELTPGGGRTLRYDENLRRDLKLLEVSIELLEELKEDRCVVESVRSLNFHLAPRRTRRMLTLFASLCVDLYLKDVIMMKQCCALQRIRIW